MHRREHLLELRLGQAPQQAHAPQLARRKASRLKLGLEVQPLAQAGLGDHSAADVALQAASLLAVNLSSYYDCKATPAVLQALLAVASAA